ncbi:MAG: metallophosphoesterase [Planctomycetota bacterium]
MRYAVISDVHSNLAALEAVLADIDAEGVSEVLCLGDVVGYGPDPIECVDLVRARASVTVQGNHDEALVHGAYGFHLRAREAVDWTRDLLRPGFFSGLAVRERWAWITSLPLRHERGPDVLVHGSPRNPTSEYLLVSNIDRDREGFEEAFAATERLLLVGHTHFPCAVTDRYEVHAAGRDYCFGRHGEGRAIVNVGSVGQPRDGDSRACYAIVEEAADELWVRWRRVEYAVEETVARVAEVARLHPSLGERLKHGA